MGISLKSLTSAAIAVSMVFSNVAFAQTGNTAALKQAISAYEVAVNVRGEDATAAKAAFVQSLENGEVSAADLLALATEKLNPTQKKEFDTEMNAIAKRAVNGEISLNDSQIQEVSMKLADSVAQKGAHISGRTAKLATGWILVTAGVISGIVYLSKRTECFDYDICSSQDFIAYRNRLNDKTRHDNEALVFNNNELVRVNALIAQGQTYEVYTDSSGKLAVRDLALYKTDTERRIRSLNSELGDLSAQLERSYQQEEHMMDKRESAKKFGYASLGGIGAGGLFLLLGYGK